MTAEDQARSRIAAAADQLLELSHRIHAHPETAWQEHRAVGWLTDALDQLGYVVTGGACQLPTAFTASVGTGELHIGICAEYDALPGLGHACGHNIIAAAAIGAATGLAGVADQLGLTVTVLGTPAEEGGGGKIFMLDRGAFDGLHAAMMIHPGPADAARAEPFAVDHQHISYRGVTAHAATYPELGVNAADAFTIAQVAIGLLRQQLPASVRVHGIVTEAGLAPNAIPGQAEGRWYVRAASLADLDQIEPRIRACFQAGALATGCELAIRPESPRYAEFRNDEKLLDLFLANARHLGRRFTDSGAGARMNRASTDMGNVSLRLPAIHPYLGIDSLPAVNHQPEFAAHCAGPAADRAVLEGAIALAATVIDAATRDNVRDYLLYSPGPGRPCTRMAGGHAEHGDQRPALLLDLTGIPSRTAACIGRTELEGQKHLLDTGITTQGRFERHWRALKDAKALCLQKRRLACRAKRSKSSLSAQARPGWR